ncbi:MAG: acyltransferase [Crocinitomicaceae bacterium]|nr:acyltransferase [Flavobacteriales bacterium]NQZ38272.1 acyltransferase [Crocinitomicaceae bacterium]
MDRYPLLLPFFVIVTAFVIARIVVFFQLKTTSTKGRHSGIDGLRGFLAMGVFIHHTVIWRNYCLTGNWEAPTSNFYNQLGQTSVALFFMISGYLFVKKLIDNRESGLNWSRFFIGRIARLVPLYYFSLLIIVLASLILNGWTLNTSLAHYMKDIGHWMAFTYMSRPALNGLFEAQIVNAGVVWSLAFEWLFYFSLPLIGVFVLKVKPHLIFILLAIGFVYLHYWSVGGFYYAQLHSFLGGAIIVVLKHYFGEKINCSHPIFGLLIIACFFGVCQFHSADYVYCKLFITAVFGIIAFGNTFFGLLTSSAFRLLGTISFSIYLLHGIVLFFTIKFIVGYEFIQQLSDLNYLLFVLLLIPVVILISLSTYQYVELPFIKWNQRRRS